MWETGSWLRVTRVPEHLSLMNAAYPPQPVHSAAFKLFGFFLRTQASCPKAVQEGTVETAGYYQGGIIANPAARDTRPGKQGLWLLSVPAYLYAVTRALMLLP